MRDGWTVVVPPPGQVKETARALLDLALSPHDVRTTNGGSEFRVPPYLADLYNAPPKALRPKRIIKKEGDE